MPVSAMANVLGKGCEIINHFVWPEQKKLVTKQRTLSALHNENMRVNELATPYKPYLKFTSEIRRRSMSKANNEITLLSREYIYATDASNKHWRKILEDSKELYRTVDKRHISKDETLVKYLNIIMQMKIKK